MFEKHGKKSDHKDVIAKIKNTIEFNQIISTRYHDFRNYFIIGRQKSEKDLEIYLKFLNEIGYKKPEYNTEPFFRRTPASEYLIYVRQTILSFKEHNHEKFQAIKNEVLDSTMYKAEAKWLYYLVKEIE
jgi:hypothetical protein